MSTEIVLIKYSGPRKYFDVFFPDLGLAYLGAVIRERGHKCTVFDLDIQRMQECVDYIKIHKPTLIGFKVYASGILEILRLAAELRKVSSKSILMAGGPHVTMFQEHLFHVTNEFDILFVGEGELSFPQLLEFAEGKRDLEEINNIIYRKDGTIQKTKRILLENLDNLPMPAWDIFDLKRYFPVFMLNMVRGCPYSCAFCTHNYLWGLKTSLNKGNVEFSPWVRRRTFEHIKREILSDIQQYGARCFSLADSTPDVSLMNSFADLILEHANKTKWVSFGLVSLFNEETLKKLAQAGCVCLWYGIESGDDNLLKKMGKPFCVKDIEETIKAVKNVGIKAVVGIIVGFPGDNEASVQKSLRLVKHLGADVVVLSPFELDPGSQVAHKPDLYNVRLANDWKDRIALECDSIESNIEYYYVDGDSNYERWNKFKRLINLPGLDEDRKVTESEYIFLLADLLNIEYRTFMDEVDKILKSGNVKKLQLLIDKCWEASK
ncbi:MAG TPA: B12-binding domain-containing radical SAM protein [Candidatus Wujingus californicus]|uniref:B12-binding domain-containing radical SAM protein n=1 Tax=Candidatus Wujingus californicus TaxID=3367618 RepID=UPI001D5734B5|nr:B12-binding domain-containing radical SAM protein [Planctomycetota bacterium]MDO8132034.1 radical SAM protein [Candidatus Brocadiales bacterium]